jgi:hypothetical protein
MEKKKVILLRVFGWGSGCKDCDLCLKISLMKRYRGLKIMKDCGERTPQVLIKAIIPPSNFKVYMSPENEMSDLFSYKWHRWQVLLGCGMWINLNSTSMRDY